MNGSIDWNDIRKKALARDRAKREAPKVEVKALEIPQAIDVQVFEYDGVFGYAINRNDGKGWLFPHRGRSKKATRVVTFDDYVSMEDYVNRHVRGIVQWASTTETEREMFELMVAFDRLANLNCEFGL